MRPRLPIIVRNLSTAASVAGAMSLAGCGGGGGTTTPDSGGANIRPDPNIATPYGAWTENPSALDIAEHWRDAHLLAEALDIEAGTHDGTGGFSAARDAAQPAGNTSRTILRNITPDQMVPIGTEGGVTVGYWRDGPAGTLDIDFDWSGAPNATPAQRALMERAGREWSRRVATERSSRTIEAGTVITHESDSVEGGTPRRVVVTQDIDPAGMLVFMFDAGDAQLSSGGPRWIDEGSGLEFLFGTIAISQRHTTFRRVATHEVGHVLGVASLDADWNEPANRYVDTTNHTFTGPNAMRENGGRPVPFQWVDANNEVAAPGSEGTMPDYGHLGVCTSVMAYCSRQEVKGPQKIDFAVLEDLGYSLLDAAEAAEPEVYGFGAWGRYSAWGAGVERQIDHDSDADHTRTNADAFGSAPAMPFADTVTDVVGSASWSGSLIGVDRSSPDFAPVLGSATLRIELDTMRGEAQFEELTTVRNAAPSPFRHTALSYDISLDGNAFSDADRRVGGALHGPQHQEMAGVLDDDRTGIELLGAFGGTRGDD